jgi:flagellar assembly factor FliW
LKVDTKAYGLVDIDDRQKIVFPQGLFGFEAIKDYVLLDASQAPFCWLQSLENVNTAFVLISPFVFRPDYELDIVDTELTDIGIRDPKTTLVFSIVTIPPDGGPMTANLQGPLVINRQTSKGKQVILSDTRWKTKHDILAELAKGDKC